jgi:ribosomal protein S18 acetylase RimI-like enzyme
MLEIRKVDESSRQWTLDYLKRDLVRHAFAYYDVQHDPEHTAMYVALEDDRLRGYILIYTALEFPSVVLECDDGSADRLIEHAPEDHFIMHAPMNLLSRIESKFPTARPYVEDWMLIKKGEASFFRSDHVQRLNTVDGLRLAALLSTGKGRPRVAEKKCTNWARENPMYGVFINGELVSCAGSFIQMPQIWVIGRVYTHPSQRNRGYATLAVSAITEEALGKSDSATLFVRSDNYPAIKAYEKIGYKKIGQKLWIDMGTGIKP